jgi:hypothetical protein
MALPKAPVCTVPNRARAEVCRRGRDLRRQRAAQLLRRVQELPRVP